MALQKCVDGKNVDMTPEEEAAILSQWAENDPENEANKKARRNEQRKRQILELEAKQNRALREAALGLGAQRLQDIENQIATLRGQIEP